MATQLNLTDSIGFEAMSSLAQEFKLQFEKTSLVLDESLTGRKFIFNRDGRESYPFEEWGEGAGGIIEEIIPMESDTTVASTDSSCILLGDTSDGSAYAVRGAIVFASGGSIEGYLRIGPIFVYLSPKGVFGLHSPLSPYELRISLSDHQIAERTIRNSMERKVIGSLLISSGEKIVMADGSLKHPMGGLLGFTPRLGNPSTALIGFSKSSSLVSSSGITSSVSRARAASFGTVDDGPVKTILAKFSSEGLVFRLDILNRNEKTADVLGKLSWNDSFAVGYPESLRLAHHLSVFTRSEDAAMKAYLTKRYSLRRLPTFGLRRMTLGSFGAAR